MSSISGLLARVRLGRVPACGGLLLALELERRMLALEQRRMLALERRRMLALERRRILELERRRMLELERLVLVLFPLFLFPSLRFRPVHEIRTAN